MKCQAEELIFLDIAVIEKFHWRNFILKRALVGHNEDSLRAIDVLKAIDIRNYITVQVEGAYFLFS